MQTYLLQNVYSIEATAQSRRGLIFRICKSLKRYEQKTLLSLRTRFLSCIRTAIDDGIGSKPLSILSSKVKSICVHVLQLCVSIFFKVGTT